MENKDETFENSLNEVIQSDYERIGREQSVIIYFNYGLEDDDPFYELGERLRALVEEKQLGIYDGHEMEINNLDGSYYLYGPSAENIFKAVKPTLESAPFMKGATAVLRFGSGENAPSLEVDIA